MAPITSNHRTMPITTTMPTLNLDRLSTFTPILDIVCILMKCQLINPKKSLSAQINKGTWFTQAHGKRLQAQPGPNRSIELKSGILPDLVPRSALLNCPTPDYLGRSGWVGSRSTSPSISAITATGNAPLLKAEAMPSICSGVRAPGIGIFVSACAHSHPSAP